MMSKLKKIEREVQELIGKNLSREKKKDLLKKEHTLKIYDREFRKFERYASYLGFEGMPYSPAIVAKYLIAEDNRGIGSQAKRKYVAAIKMVHECYDLKDPTRDPLVRATVKYLKMSKDGPARTRIKRLGDRPDLVPQSMPLAEELIKRYHEKRDAVLN